MIVSGPNGEIERLSQIHSFLDPSTPQGQKMIQFQTQNGRRQLPDQFTVYPYGRDTVEAFRAYLQQASQRAHVPEPTFTVTSTTKVPPGRGSLGGLTILADLDLHDGTGMRAALFQFSVMRRIDPSGLETLMASGHQRPGKNSRRKNGPPCWPSQIAWGKTLR